MLPSGARGIDLEKAASTVFDVAIIGGGINGASLFNRLSRCGHAVILLDKGDFASGTSQASGMLIWGGLLYLKHGDLRGVYEFSRARERMLREHDNWIAPRELHYLSASHGRMGKGPVLAGLYLYWLLSRFRRRRPRLDPGTVTARFGNRTSALVFEEGELRPSDSRFVLHRILSRRDDWSAALNYAEVLGGKYSPGDRQWRLHVREGIANSAIEIRARTVVNCAGVWTDRVNVIFGIKSPLKHVFSKGVYLLLQRNSLDNDAYVLKMDGVEDVLTSVPWGPVEMWGPTEDLTEDIDAGFKTTAEDVAFLLDQRRRLTGSAGGKSDIVALRCGVRPLPVAASYAGKGYPLGHSRLVQVIADDVRPWLSVYGGKLTGCTDAARVVERQLHRFLPKPPSKPIASDSTPAIEWSSVPGLDAPQPSAAWCRDHEGCQTLEDYLRRRTNIAQWIHRGGLAHNDENADFVRRASLTIAGGNAERAEKDFKNYSAKVSAEFDAVLARV
jgi:glycerol-3-phosphate dehydrogenase